MIRIVRFDGARADHRRAFRDLNLAWLEAHFPVEPRDWAEIEGPDTHIIDAGGAVFVAEDGAGEDARVVGVAALVREPDGTWELAKLAVGDAARGQGTGRALVDAVIAEARARGATEIELLSNTVLESAIRLYRRMGFVEVPIVKQVYETANIRMVLPLERA